MRDRPSRFAGLAVAIAAVLGTPFATACYPPRIESCRDALTDFSDLGAVAITDVGLEGRDEGGSISLAYTVRASSTSTVVADRCVAVHSELWQSGTLLSTIDTSVAARLGAGVLTTSRVIHYRTPLSGLTLRVMVLGQTLEVDVDDRLRPPDAGAGGDASP